MKIAFLNLLLFTSMAFAQTRELLPRVAVTNSLAGGGSPTPEIAWWKMNEGSGTTVADSSGGGHTLTLSSSSMWTTGKAGGAIAGDGISRFASTAATLNLGTNKVTICFWLTDSSYTGEIVFELGPNIGTTFPGFYFFAQDASTLDASLRNTASFIRTRTASPPSTGTFHHYLLVYDNATPDILIYVDGSATGTTGSAGVADSANWITDTFYILSRAGSSLFSNATIDDFRIYSGDKSSSVAAIMADPQ